MAVPVHLRDRVPYSAIESRPPVRWPDNARLAVWLVPNVEHYEFKPTHVGERDPWPRTPHPDVAQYSWRDYGNRVGIWRLLRILDEFELTPTFALNSGSLAYYPELTEMIATRACAVMGHGVYNTAYVNHLDAGEEREWLIDIIDTVRSSTGKSIKGTLGPGISATTSTPDLLAEVGLLYQSDWVLDDQPTPILVQHGRLISMPYSFELNDARMIGDACTPEDFFDACRRQFRMLLREGGASGRVLGIAFHTFVSGQPHMADGLRRLFAELRDEPGVWFTTADEIAAWYLDHHYAEHLSFALGNGNAQRPLQ